METIWVDKLVYEDSEWKWKSFAEQVDTKVDFSIDEDNLNVEICRTGQLLVRYGDLAANMSTNLKRKEENVKYVQARVAGALRSSAEATGSKLTEPQLAAKVVEDDQYQQALSELHAVRANALRADHWWRSIVKKTDLINALAYRQNAEIKRMPG